MLLWLEDQLVIIDGEPAHEVEGEMSDRRIVSEDEAFRLLASCVATAELHVVEGPFYTDRRILDAMLPLIDAMIRDGDRTGSTWLEAFKTDLERAIASRGRDRQAYDAFLRAAPGRIVDEIKRRRQDHEP